MRNVMSVLSSFIIAFVLMLLPVFKSVAWLMPNWVLLVLLFWVVVFPERVGITVAFLLGLMLDVLQGTLLGEHALAMMVLVYLLIKFHYRFQRSSCLFQCMFIAVLVMLYQLMIYTLHGFAGQVSVSVWYWFAPFVAMILWPVSYRLLRRRLHNR